MESHSSTTCAFFGKARAKREEKETHKALLPYHLSFQKLTLLPLPTLEAILSLNIFYSFSIAFERHTLYPSLTSREHHPFFSTPYFPLITCFHRAPLSSTKCQHHLQRRALLSKERHLTPKPPFLLYKQTIPWFTK